MKKIYVTGVSGNGKSAVVKELKKSGLLAFDIEDIENMCYWIDKKTNEVAQDHQPTMEWLNNHDWVCNISLLKDLLDQYPNQTIIISGITGNQDEYLKLFDKVILLQSQKDIFLNRIKNRHLNPDENSFGKNQVERDFVENIYEEFEAKLIKEGAIPINSELPINKVVAEILTKI